METIIYAVTMGLLVTAMIYDIREYHIPNWISLALLGVVVACWGINAITHTRLPDVIQSLMAMGVVFLFTFTLWHFGLLGGGDVKLLTALCGVAGVRAIGLVYVVILAGGIESIILYVVRKTRLGEIIANTYPILNPLVLSGRNIPYGIAICCGGTYVFLDLIWQMPT